MNTDSIPLRWPAAWKDPGILSWLQASPVRFSILDAEAKVPPSGVFTVRGPWPGIRLSPAGGDHAVAGPTGEPWVDSNGWRIRAARAVHPEATIWVDSKPQASRSSVEDYVIALADAAAHGGRWIITLDDRLAAGIRSKQADDMAAWKRISDAAGFFAQSKTGGYADDAVIGVLSSFGGPKVGFTDEVLNNLARTKQQYRAMAMGRLSSAAFDGLKGIIYTDASEPPSSVRKQVLEFVNAGGMLITGPAWGSLPKGPAAGTHPRFALRTVGSGSIALATTSFADPYLAPNDAVMLASHRNDIVRFFNGGAITPCLSTSADKRQATLQTVFYSLRPVEDVSVWVKGAWRSARLRTPNQTEPQNVKLEVREGGVEMYLPPIAQYALIELES
jgi:hypothetical protein